MAHASRSHLSQSGGADHSKMATEDMASATSSASSPSGADSLPS